MKGWSDDSVFFDDSKKGKGKGVPLPPPCYKTHPALVYGDLKLYGGSCSYPAVTDADIYVALQDGASSGFKTDPWEEKQVIEVKFPITDSLAPKSSEVERFKKMVTWICNQLQAGKKIHTGCIGGHGRTGLVLSAVIAELGEKDAIGYVRKNYCEKAVETSEQVQFLMKHYGVEPATARKTDLFHGPKSSGKGFSSYTGAWDDKPVYTGVSGKQYGLPLAGPASIKAGPKAQGGDRMIVPVGSAKNIWKRRKSN